MYRLVHFTYIIHWIFDFKYIYIYVDFMFRFPCLSDMFICCSPLNSYLYIHWILDFKYIIITPYDIYVAHVPVKLIQGISKHGY